MARIRGFDTSRHNHNNDQPIDFEVAYENDYEFWAGRLTVGDYYLDPWIERDFKAAGQTPIVRIVYVVPHPELPIETQIAKIKEGLALLGEDPDAIVFDVEIGREEGANAVTDCLGAHVSEVRAFYSGRLILYSNLDYLLHYILDTFGLDIWISWPASEGAFNPNPTPPITNAILYQRSYTNEIPGVPDKTVDYDEWLLGDEAFLEYFCLDSSEDEDMDLTPIIDQLSAITGILIEIRDELKSGSPGPGPGPNDQYVGYVNVTNTKGYANGWIEVGKNAKGKPIMDLPPVDQRDHFSGRVGYYEHLASDQVNGDMGFYRVTTLTTSPVEYLAEKDVEPA